MEDSYSLMASVDMYLYQESYGCIFGDRAERLSAHHPITNTAPIQRQGEAGHQPGDLPREGPYPGH